MSVLLWRHILHAIIFHTVILHAIVFHSVIFHAIIFDIRYITVVRYRLIVSLCCLHIMIIQWVVTQRRRTADEHVRI